MTTKKTFADIIECADCTHFFPNNSQHLCIMGFCYLRANMPKPVSRYDMACSKVRLNEYGDEE